MTTAPTCRSVNTDTAPEPIQLGDGTRIIWKRELKAECELAAKLKSAGLQPFAKVVFHHLLHHSLRYTFVPIAPQGGSMPAWLTLRDKGNLRNPPRSQRGRQTVTQASHLDLDMAGGSGDG